MEECALREKIATVMSALPSAFLCPLNNTVMKNPMIATDGYTYDRESIEVWLETSGNSPITGDILESRELRPNHTLKSAIEEIQIHGLRSDLNSFYGPITQDLMMDPVVAADGHTYDRTSITHWFRHRRTSPITNCLLESEHLIPNHALKQAILELPKKLPSHRTVACHNSVTCDGCGEYPILGTRYKSHSSKNFDVCEKCEASGNFVAHEPFYKIVDSRLIGRPSSTVTMPNEVEPAPEPMTLMSAYYTVKHSTVTCDGCFLYPIVGPRFKSTVAHDFDLCEECEATGRYYFCEPFLKISDSRKIGRPGSVACAQLVDDVSSTIVRTVRRTSVCWTPNLQDVIQGTNINSGMLLQGIRRVRGVDGAVFLELPGNQMGFSIQQIFIPEEDNDTVNLQPVEPFEEHSQFIAKRKIVKQKWPGRNQTIYSKGDYIRAGEVFETNQVVYDDSENAFYRLANTNEWVSFNEEDVSVSVEKYVREN